MDFSGPFADLRASLAPLLDELDTARQAHSVAVGALVARVVDDLVPARHRLDVVTAAMLHDIGYARSLAHTGFHPVDGATALRTNGFAPVVCDLVATHTGARWEAVERGIDPTEIDVFVADEPGIEQLRDVLTWADLNTSPQGEPISPEDRIAEILTRYDEGHPVGRSVRAHQHELVAAGYVYRVPANPHPSQG